MLEKKKRTAAEAKRGQPLKQKEEKGAEAERKRGLEQRIFQHLFSFQSSQKNYGELVCVGFNF